MSKKNYSKILSEQYGIPENLVDDVLLYGWKSIREALGMFKDVHVAGIGTFRLRENKARHLIDKLSMYLKTQYAIRETETEPDKREGIDKKIEAAQNDVQFIKNLLNED